MQAQTWRRRAQNWRAQKISLVAEMLSADVAGAASGCRAHLGATRYKNTYTHGQAAHRGDHSSAFVWRGTKRAATALRRILRLS